MPHKHTLSEHHTYEFANPEHESRIIDFLQNHFRVEDPVIKALDLSEVDCKGLFGDIVKQSTKYPLSLLVHSNDKKEIVGLLLASIIDRYGEEHLSAGNPNAAASKLTNLHELLEKDLWSLVPDEVDRVLQIHVVNTRPDHLHEHIAHNAIEMTLTDGREMRLGGAVVAATSTVAQTAFKHQQFEVLRTVDFKSYVDAEGKPYIASCHDGTDKAELLFKAL